jgi:hypothetical protein
MEEENAACHAKSEICAEASQIAVEVPSATFRALINVVDNLEQRPPLLIVVLRDLPSTNVGTLYIIPSSQSRYGSWN